MANKKTILVGVIISFAVFFTTSLITNGAEISLSDLEQTKDFISSAREIGEQAAGVASSLDKAWQTMANVWGSIDGWFFETTEVHILDTFKLIGNFIVWFLELVLSLFRWLLSLIG